jgi:hypothetical protein
MSLLKSKIRASLIHFSLSAVLLGLCMLLIFFVWYPFPYYRIMAAEHILLVLVGVDLVLGPLLTLLVYKPGKKSLKFDLSVIVLIQLVALVYGMHAFHSERPAYMVFAVDRFDVLAAKDVDMTGVSDPRFSERPLRGPLMLVAKLPEDPQALAQLNDEILFQGKPDVERRPELWSLYADDFGQAVAAAKPLQELGYAQLDTAPAIEASARRAGLPVNELRFLPVIGKQRDFAIVLESRNGELVDIIAADPWIQ